jgi:hypothetical protein
VTGDRGSDAAWPLVVLVVVDDKTGSTTAVEPMVVGWVVDVVVLVVVGRVVVVVLVVVGRVVVVLAVVVGWVVVVLAVVVGRVVVVLAVVLVVVLAVVVLLAVVVGRVVVVLAVVLVVVLAVVGEVVGDVVVLAVVGGTSLPGSSAPAVMTGGASSTAKRMPVVAASIVCRGLTAYPTLILRERSWNSPRRPSTIDLMRRQ